MNFQVYNQLPNTKQIDSPLISQGGFYEKS
mgnify:CR=1 FL=1